MDGKWIDRKTHKEDIEVFNLIKDILINRKENEIIEVMTLNITQKDLIEEMLEIEVAKDLVFGIVYTAENDRVENNEDISLFVKNI